MSPVLTGTSVFQKWKYEVVRDEVIAIGIKLPASAVPNHRIDTVKFSDLRLHTQVLLA